MTFITRTFFVAFIALIPMSFVMASDTIPLTEATKQVGDFTDLIEDMYVKALAKHWVLSNQIPHAQFDFTTQYQNEYYTEQKNHSLGTQINAHEALEKAAQSRVVMVSDAHGTPEIRDLVLTLLKHMLSANAQPKIFLFELIGSQFQSDMDDYMAGKITEQELHSKVNWDDVIGYGWEVYVPLFEFLKANKIKTRVVLRPSEDVNLYNHFIRDNHVVQIVQSELKDQPQAQIFVWQGRAHLIGSNHVADKLFKIYDDEAVLFLTEVSHLYWKALASGYSMNTSLFLEVAGGTHKNTYFTHSAVPLDNDTYILKKISGYITRDANQQSELLRMVENMSTHQRAATNSILTKDAESAMKSLMLAKAAALEWATLALKMEDPDRILPTVKQEIELILKF